MHIDKFEIRPYELYFQQLGIKSKQGAHLVLSFENGMSYTGDISPLPPYGKETLDDALNEFKRIRSHSLTEMLKEATSPSLYFALDSIQNELTHPIDPIPVQAVTQLLFANHSNFVSDFHNAIEQGHTSIKVKVGNLTSQEAIQLFRELPLAPISHKFESDHPHLSGYLSDSAHHQYLEDIGSSPYRKSIPSGCSPPPQLCEKCGQARISLRLDMNRNWKAKEAIAFLSSLPPHAIDYVEEPGADFKSMDMVRNETGCALALDETLRLYPLENLINDIEFDVAIIKPSLQPYLLETIAKLNLLSKKWTLSSSFESVIGIDQIKKMALREQQPYPLGIDTIKFIKDCRYAVPC
ncbi:MAG: hypothetical protein K9M13_02400 [Simkaniaceae bacterium]|nr:hypothetical protein [Simkaniaceae bacterium]